MTVHFPANILFETSAAFGAGPITVPGAALSARWRLPSAAMDGKRLPLVIELVADQTQFIEVSALYTHAGTTLSWTASHVTDGTNGAGVLVTFDAGLKRVGSVVRGFDLQAFGRSVLVATGIKTSAHTAAVGEAVRTNSAAGSFDVTLPANTDDGAVVGLDDYGHAWETNPVVLKTSDGATFTQPNGDVVSGATGVELDGGNSAVWRYEAGADTWTHIGQTGLLGSSSPGGGVSTFGALTDAFPLAGQALKFPRVNATGTALEPVDSSVFVVSGVEIITPEQYGAVGDGTTDDSTALVAMAADIAGKIVWMGAGKVYAVAASATINAKDNWLWLGNNSTILALSTYPVASEVWGPLRIIDSDGWGMCDQIVDGNRAARAGANGGSGVAQLNVIIAKCFDWRMVRVKSYRAASDGFMLQNFGASTDAANYCVRGELIDCEAVGSGRNGLSAIAARDITIRGGLYSGSNVAGPCAGIDLEPQAAQAVPAVAGIRIIDVVIEDNSGSGIIMLQSGDLEPHYVTDILIQGCRIRRNGGRVQAAGAANATGEHAPIYIRSKGMVSILDNYIEDHTLVITSTRGIGIYVHSLLDGLKLIRGNRLRGNSGLPGTVASADRDAIPGQIAIDPDPTGVGAALIEGNLIDLRGHTCAGIVFNATRGAVIDNMIIADGSSNLGVSIWGTDVTQRGNRSWGGAPLDYGPGADLAAGRTRQIYSATDDAEELVSTTVVTLDSSDLELGVDAGAQLVGVRFDGIAAAQGTTSPLAYVQFVPADSPGSGAITITVKAEDVDDSAAFLAVNANISGRALTTAQTVVVNPAAWTKHVAGPEARFDVTGPLNEVFARGGWASGNAVAFIFSAPSGTRRGWSTDGDGNYMPRLVIEISA